MKIFKRRPKYHYDQETCTYVPVRPTGASIARKIGSSLLFVLVVGAAAWFGFDQFLVGIQEQVFQKEQSQLLTQLEQANVTLDQYEARLDAYYQRTNSFYRPVVGEAQIPSSYWNGGRGGSSRYDQTDTSLPNKTQLRIERIAHQIELLRNSYALVGEEAASKETAMRNLPSIMPVNGELISMYGMRRHPVTGRHKLHEGVDFACGIGTPIYAPGDALVTSTGDIANGYGINVNLDHQNGYKTKFAHLSRAVVQIGQRVKRGELIGYSGNTGLSTGPHLHYEVSLNDVKIDPIDFFYQDLPPREYRRLKLDKQDVTVQVLKEKLSDSPAMD
ncbi:MAG: M23 family metallopeptidase [Bacteroidota bacterium]